MALGQTKRVKFACLKGGFCHLDKQNGSNLLVPKRILLLGQAKRIKFAWPKEDFVIWTRKRHIESNLLVPKSVIWTSKKDQICLSQKRIFLSFGQAKKIVSSG